VAPYKPSKIQLGSFRFKTKNSFFFLRGIEWVVENFWGQKQQKKKIKKKKKNKWQNRNRKQTKRPNNKQ